MAAPAARAPTTTTSWRGERWWSWLVLRGQRAAGGRRRRRRGGRRRSVGVVADAVDEVRVAAVLEALAEDVQPGDRRDAAPLADLAVGVEDRDLQPRVGAAVAGGPDDRADAVAACRSSDVSRRRRAQPGGRARRRGPRAVEAGGVDVVVDLGRAGGASRSSAAATVVAAGRRRTSSRSPSTPVRRPASRTPSRCERGQVDVAAVGAADELQRRPRAGAASGRAPRRWSVRTCRSGRATTRCPCRGSGGAAGCGGRRRARPRGRRGRARRRSGRRWPTRRRPAPAVGQLAGLR